MSQHDMNVGNGPGLTFRTDMNAALVALASHSSGASAPATTYPCQVWADTGTGRLKQRDSTNTFWIDRGNLDSEIIPPTIVGTSRTAKMSVTAASASGTFTADELIVAVSLSGAHYRIPTFNKTVNISGTGVGGMDIGTPPISGFVSIYAIYNPTTNDSALLACTQTVSDGPIYNGSNMPAGYTASALVSIWPTTAGQLLNIGFQADRTVARPSATILNNSTIVSSQSSLSIAGSAPTAAKFISGLITVTSTSTSTVGVTLFPSASTPGGAQQFVAGLSPAGAFQTNGFTNLLVASPSAIGFITQSSAGTPTFTVVINAYTI